MPWLLNESTENKNESFMLQVLKNKRTRVKVLTKLKSVQNKKKYEDGQKEPFVLKSVLFQWKVKKWIMKNTEFMMRFYNYDKHWSFVETL